MVIFPLLYELDEDYPFAEIHAKVRQAVGDRAILIDLLDDLKGQDADDLWVHPTDQHPNEIVHAIAARRIAEEIERRGILKRVAP